MARSGRLVGIGLLIAVLLIVVWQVGSAAWTAADESAVAESSVPLVLAGSCFAVIARSLRRTMRKH